MALAPSRARCSCFLKPASARSRASFEVFAKMASLRAMVKGILGKRRAGTLDRRVTADLESASGHCSINVTLGLRFADHDSADRAALTRPKHPWPDSTRNIHALARYAISLFQAR